MRAAALAWVIVPAVLGWVTVQCAMSGDIGSAAVAGWLAAGTGAAWVIHAAEWRAERARWTRAEKAALKGWMDMEGLLSATPAPREGERQ